MRHEREVDDNLFKWMQVAWKKAVEQHLKQEEVIHIQPAAPVYKCSGCGTTTPAYYHGWEMRGRNRYCCKSCICDHCALRWKDDCTPFINSGECVLNSD